MPSRTAPATTRLKAAEVIALLDLAPHPEGGHYRETFRDVAPGGGRAASTAIYFLLQGDDVSRWHRVDAAEVWHWYAGAPLELRIADAGKDAQAVILGSHLEQGERPQIVVPANSWQSATSLGPWTLAGCTVAPGFEFSGFEMAPDDWEPSG